MIFIKSLYHGLWLTSTYIKEFKEAVCEKYTANLILVFASATVSSHVIGTHTIQSLSFLIYK